MARNEEKHYGRLNRLLLQKQKDDYFKLHPKRPKLETLNTAEEVKQWIPSIKRDIDFFLKKSQVVCYSDDQVNEARLMVSKLEKEFKAFLRKIRQLSPGTTEVPWTSRAYKSKTEVVEKSSSDESEFVPLPTPILNMEEPEQINNQNCTDIPLPMMNQPLVFISSSEVPSNMSKRKAGHNQNDDENCNHSSKCLRISRDCKTFEGSRENDNYFVYSASCDVHDSHTMKEAHLDPVKNKCELEHSSNPQSQKKNILGLDYELSSSDEEEEKHEH